MKNLTPEVTNPVLKASFRANRLFLAKLFYTTLFFTVALTNQLFAQAPTISYSSPHIYTQGTTIAPLSPTSSGVATPAYGDTLAIASGLAPGAFNTGNVAADVAGNLYVADPSTGTIKKVPAGSSTAVTFASGFSSPQYVATDAAGNLYVSDAVDHAVYKIPAGGGSRVLLSSALKSPSIIAVDPTGSVYVVDFDAVQNNYDIKKIPVGGGTPVALNLSAYLYAPHGLAVDASGNIYVTNYTFSTFDEFVAGSGPPQIVSGGGLTIPINVAIDPAGNLFGVLFELLNNPIDGTLGNFGTAGVAFEMTPGGGGSNLAGNYNSAPISVAIDGAGNLYIAYVASSGLIAVNEIKPLGGYYIDRFLPRGLSFDSATGIISGTPTVASPATNYTITAYNSAGVSSSAVVNIAVSPANPNNANLLNLTLSSGTLSPAFAGTTTNYTAAVSNAITSITVTPAAAVAQAGITVNGVATASGSPSASIPLSVGKDTITTIVTAQDGITKNTYTVIVTRAASANASLANLTISSGTLTSSGPNHYIGSVSNATTSVTLTPTASDPTATIAINGVTTASGSPSASIPLSVGANSITIIVTAQDGITKNFYTLTVTRAGSTSANTSLANLTISGATLTPGFTGGTTNYTASVGNATTSITVTPTAADPIATITVNGTPVVSGSASAGLPLSVGTNTITIAVTRENTTTDYTVTVTRALSDNAFLANLAVSSGTISPAFTSKTFNYTSGQSLTTSTITVTPTTSNAFATVKVNGIAVISGTPSLPIALSNGVNHITIVVTAQNGIDSRTYSLAVTKEAGIRSIIEQPSIADDGQLAEDGIKVHTGLSPNGDGINDILVIDGIAAYPENKLTIIDRSGEMVFEAKGYDNSSKIFDGHSSKNGAMQLPGTYFYSLDYSINGQNKHKTGFIILKY